MHGTLPLCSPNGGSLTCIVTARELGPGQVLRPHTNTWSWDSGGRLDSCGSCKDTQDMLLGPQPGHCVKGNPPSRA